MTGLALVVGNAQYNNPQHQLDNAVNDAKDFGDKLFSLGYVVHTWTDCTREVFENKLAEFAEELKQYEVGLFYFSGHGLQIDGVNYLTSIDTAFQDGSSAKYTSTQLDLVVDYMKNADPKMKILILDACRNNPLPSSFRGVQLNGLAPIHAPKGTLIAFSTSPGETAMDSGAGRNSIYTGALLNHINDADIPIEDFFKRVRTSVYTLSNGRQTSWEHTSLIGKYYFNSGQMVHATGMSYIQDVIADETFISSGTPIDKIIEDLKSHNYYSQHPALQRLNNIDALTIDVNSQFLIGRNLLQVAAGGENSAMAIMRRLGSWLSRFNQSGANHVLNGILFEIYFNSKGLFRREGFKTAFISEIFALSLNPDYSPSFEFIQQQLTPFQRFLFFIPGRDKTSIAFEIFLEKEIRKTWADNTFTHYWLRSLKHENVELLEIKADPRNQRSLSYEELLDKMENQLATPKSFIRISSNLPLLGSDTITVPFNFTLQRPELNQQDEKNLQKSNINYY